MIRLLRERPWILLAALFAAFLFAWAVWLGIALRHTPERVPLEDDRHAPAR